MQVSLVSSFNLSSWFRPESEPVMLSLPLGLLSIAAVLEKNGHDPKIVDLNFALAQKELTISEGFYETAAGKILESNPELVGFSTMCNSYHTALMLAKTVKAKAPKVLIVFGGPQASAVDVDTLAAFPFVDMVLRGEAEQSFVQLLEALSGNGMLEDVGGLTRRVNGEIVRHKDQPLIKNLDMLPYPAYHLFPYKIENPTPIDIGRGCPFNCSFCSTSSFWKRDFRLKSIDRIIQEIKYLKSKFNVNSFSFMHDLFTVNKSWLIDFCDRLGSEKLGITWTCSARIDCVDEAMLKRMASVGCQAIFYGIESGSERMQRIIGKQLKLDQVQAIIDATLDAKMEATISFICGFYDETPDDIHATLSFIQSFLMKNVNIQLHLLAPQVGTKEYDMHSGALEFDGYFSDIAGTTNAFLEEEWIRSYRTLFASYYFFRNRAVARDFYVGLDLFMQGPVAIMRGTVLKLLEPEVDLYGLYSDWRRWANVRGIDRQWYCERTIEKLLMNFYDFAQERVIDRKIDFDMGYAKDEILAFYLRQYNQTPVHFVTINNENETTSSS